MTMNPAQSRTSRRSLRLGVALLLTAFACAVHADGHARSASDATTEEITLVTIADARSGVGQAIATGGPGDLPGNLFVFDQPLLNSRYEPIGTNSGYCIRTLPGKHSQCLWTLTLANGTITVAGSEADAGTSLIPVIGGTGAYLTAGGMLATTPNGDRTYTQVLTLLLHATASAREP